MRVGIRLPDCLLGCPVIVVVDRVDDAKELRILVDTVEHATHAKVHCTTWPLDIRTSGRDNKQQWLFARAHAGSHGVYERIIRVLVELVDDRIVRRGAISGFANNRLKARQIRWNPDSLGCNLDSERLAEVDRLLRHLHRGAKHLERLLFARRAAIHLGTHLSVCRKHVQARSCSDGRLAVHARHLDVCLPKAAQVVLLPHPTPDAREDTFLPPLEANGFATTGPLALHVLEELDKATDILRPRFVESIWEAPRLRCLELRQVTLARTFDPLARGHTPIHHVASVLVRIRNMPILGAHACPVRWCESDASRTDCPAASPHLAS